MSARPRPLRKLVLGASLAAGLAIVVASLLVVARSWSAACCDPSRVSALADGGVVAAWPEDLDHGDR